MKRLSAFLTSIPFALVTLAGAARADEMPLSVLLSIPFSANIAQAQSGRTYAWIDANYQSANVPVGNPGQTATLNIISPAYTPLRETDPFPNGFGIRGAVGAILPSGTFSEALGSDVRVEFAAAYSDIGGLMMQEPLSRNDPPLFNGGNSLIGCAAIINCLPSAMSPTTYQTLQFDLRAASDFRLGRATLTPSLTLFTKDARSQQNFFEASGSSSWSEWGARFGLDTTIELSPRNSVSFRASVGSAYRTATFASNEIVSFADGSGAGALLTAGHWSGTPFIGTAEASYLMRPASNVTLRTFVGMMYDSRTPVSSESLGFDPTLVGPISYQAMLNYYYGIGLKVHFDANGS